MTLWHLLVGMCFATPFVAAFDTATKAKAGLGGYALALALALVMGAGFGWLLWTTGGAVGERIQQRSSSLQAWYFRALYFSAVVWIVVVGLVAQQTLSTVLRLVA